MTNETWSLSRTYMADSEEGHRWKSFVANVLVAKKLIYEVSNGTWGRAFVLCAVYDTVGHCLTINTLLKVIKAIIMIFAGKE